MSDQEVQKQGYDDGARWSRIFQVRTDAPIQDKSELGMMFAGWAGITNPKAVMAYTRGFIDGLDGAVNKAASSLEDKLDAILDLARQGRLPAPQAQ